MAEDGRCGAEREKEKILGRREKGEQKVLRKVWRFMEVSGWSGFKFQPLRY